MEHGIHDPNARDDLRSRAVAHLKGRNVQVEPSTALRVLYELASSPSTAPDALALLHELQVHQVEVDLQEEELRRSRAELETSLHRQMQLYDHAPVGLFTLDARTTVRELNQTAAALLGAERNLLRGCSLESFLTVEGGSLLRAMLARVAGGGSTEFGDLTLRPMLERPTRLVHASACWDPAGGAYLLGLSGYPR